MVGQKQPKGTNVDAVEMLQDAAQTFVEAALKAHGEDTVVEDIGNGILNVYAGEQSNDTYLCTVTVSRTT